MNPHAARHPLARYTGEYSDHGFWRKIRGLARTAGRDLLERALCLYYAAQRPETPPWARTVAAGALGYLILPADAVPDLAPVVGYADDLTVLALALTTIAAHVDETVRSRARSTLRQWLGS